MLGKWMNNFYYGKSGKGDYTEDDLPANRWQLFWETLRVRFSALVRLNLMYVVVWLPTMLVLLLAGVNLLSSLGVEEAELGMTLAEMVQTVSVSTLLLLIPCIAITGPFTAGVCYVTRNWSRDEHAFIWSDFKDAVKENWKQSLVVSLITAVIPMLVYICWNFYGQMAAQTPLLAVPQALIALIGVLWFLSVTYFYPLIVSYKLRLRDVLRNGLLLAVARLPMSVGIRLLHCVPMLLGIGLMFFVNPLWCILGLFAYYALIGYSLSRFITASYTNAVFDRYINSRIDGAKVNRGLRADTDDDDDDEEDGEDDA